jgi:hypothetical protein
VKRTLERGLTVPEIAKREANETSLLCRGCLRRSWIGLGAPSKGLWVAKAAFLGVSRTKSQRQLGIR